jgi:hypothetical protein
MKPKQKKEAHPEFDLGASFEARDEAIARVVRHSDEAWRTNVRRLLTQQCPGLQVPFIWEDFVRYAKPRIGRPHHHNAWSGMADGAVKRGDVLATGEFRYMKKVSSHGRKSDLYEWPKRGVICDL